MKKLFAFVAAVLFSANVFAQSPDKMSYQAVVRDAGDNLITNQTVGMQISILQGSAGGTAVYVETQTPVANANGLVSIEIGGGSVVSGDFSAIDWADGPFFIKTETAPAGGTSYSISSTSQLLSVPYALHAKTTEKVIGEDLWKRINHLEKLAGTPAVTDADGNTYNSVTIDDKIWMAENLRSVSYNDGAPIPYVTGDTEWAGLETGAYCIYPHDSIDGLNSDAEVIKAYGALYNWHAVNTGKLCPTGWHVATNDDYAQLVAFLVGQGYPNDDNYQNGPANALKSCRQVDSPLGVSCLTTEHPRWNQHGARWGFDAYFFSALPGGWRWATDGGFYYVGRDGRWWTSDEFSETIGYSWSITLSSGSMNSGTTNKPQGYSVRCVKD